MAGVGDPQTVMVMRAGSDTEMTSGLGGDTARLIMDTPGIARDASAPHRLARALRHRRSSAEEGSGATPTCRLRGVSSRKRLQVRTEREDRRGADVRARHERNHRRPRRRRGSSSRLTVGSKMKWGQNTWTGRRHLRGGRQRRGIGDLVRRQGAAAGVSAAATAISRSTRGSPRAEAFQAFKDALTSNPQLIGHRHPRAGVLRAAVAKCCSRSSARSASSSPG